MIVIYKIVNKINNKIYIGQTSRCLQKRFNRHCWKSEVNKKMVITLAINKYGKENFYIQEIDICKNYKEDNEKEVKWIKYYQSLCPNGYNVSVGGNNKGMTEETKNKISKSNKGKKATKETIEKLIKSHLGFKVRQETKDKLSLANKGKKLSKEHKEKIGLSNLGKKASTHSKELMRQKKIKYEYEILSPEGVLYVSKNLMLFCLENNLNSGHMNQVSLNKKNHYKGWKITP